MRGGMSLPSVRPLLGIKYGGQDAFREGISRTLENAFAMQAPSEENETRRPGNHHFKQKALRQCHCTPPFSVPAQGPYANALGKFRPNTQFYRIILRLLLHRTSNFGLSRRTRLLGKVHQ